MLKRPGGAATVQVMDRKLSGCRVNPPPSQSLGVASTHHIRIKGPSSGTWNALLSLEVFGGWVIRGSLSLRREGSLYQN